MNMIHKKADLNAASNHEDEHGRRTHGGFSGYVVTDCGKDEYAQTKTLNLIRNKLRVSWTTEKRSESCRRVTNEMWRDGNDRRNLWQDADGKKLRALKMAGSRVV